MSFFGNRRPRGFHHVPVYYDERKERVHRIEGRRRKGNARSSGTGTIIALAAALAALWFLLNT